eukprot:m.77370 g.77370  ORF g.77370 m.77370 type:complete len:392 (+) comp9132_c0_seq1:231-1406(+)
MSDACALNNDTTGASEAQPSMEKEQSAPDVRLTVPDVNVVDAAASNSGTTHPGTAPTPASNVASPATTTTTTLAATETSGALAGNAPNNDEQGHGQGSEGGSTSTMKRRSMHGGNSQDNGQSEPQRQPSTPTTPRSPNTELEHQVAEELKLRMEVYEGLTILSALLVSAALFIFVQARASAPTAFYPGVAIANMLLTTCVLTANVYGTAIILLQKHKAGVRISMKRYRGAIQGWHRVWPQRENAVMAITYSLPGMLIAAAFFMLGGVEVKQGNWAAFSLLAGSSIMVLMAIVRMEEEFTLAEASDKDIRSLMAWSSARMASLNAAFKYLHVRPRGSAAPQAEQEEQKQPRKTPHHQAKSEIERDLVDRLGYETLTRRKPNDQSSRHRVTDV